MAIRLETHTVHTLVIDLPDDIASKVEDGDEVKLVLNARGGQTSVKTLTWRDIELITGNRQGPSRY